MSFLYVSEEAIRGRKNVEMGGQTGAFPPPLPPFDRFLRFDFQDEHSAPKLPAIV